MKHPKDGRVVTPQVHRRRATPVQDADRSTTAAMRWPSG